MARLGQNFLIDSNILAVIARAAQLSEQDVVLEIGGGLGVLSKHLAPRVAHLHVIEIDRGLQQPLERALAPFENVTLHWGDAMKLDLAALRPAPSKVLSNLPYSVAASVLLRTIELLPTVELWIAMVQREVGQRLAGRPGGDYGVSSVIAQLSCEVSVLRAIPRTVFKPQPNVDSVLVKMARSGPSAPESLRALVKAAFAHRRKALAKSVSIAAPGMPALAGPSGPAAASGGPGLSGAIAPLSRERVMEALRQIGLPVDVRAERLSPADFRELWKALCA